MKSSTMVVCLTQNKQTKIVLIKTDYLIFILILGTSVSRRYVFLVTNQKFIFVAEVIILT